MQSTNDYATYLLSKSNPIEGTVISTYKQLSGKGQIGRGWFSDEFNNISLSIILRPTFLEIKDYFLLSIITALSVHKVVSELTNDENVSIKWPNDIYINDDKVAGLLIQQSLQGSYILSSIIGIGLNVNQQEFPATLPNPISLFQVTKELASLEEVKEKILHAFNEFYTRLKNNDFVSLKKEYLDSMYKLGMKSSFLHDSGRIEGEIVGIDDTGKLQVLVDSLVRSFSMHEVKFILE